MQCTNYRPFHEKRFCESIPGRDFPNLPRRYIGDLDFRASLADWHKEIVPFPTGYATFVYAAPSHRLVSRAIQLRRGERGGYQAPTMENRRFLVIFPRCHTQRRR